MSGVTVTHWMQQRGMPSDGTRGAKHCKRDKAEHPTARGMSAVRLAGPSVAHNNQLNTLTAG